MEQARLGREDGAVAVGGDRAAFADEVHRPAIVAAAREPALGERGVVGIGVELLAPGVEPEVDAGPPLVAGHVHGPGVAEPRVVDGQLDHLDAAAAAVRGAFGIGRPGEHRDRLVLGDGLGDRHVLGLGLGEELAPQRRA